LFKGECQLSIGAGGQWRVKSGACCDQREAPGICQSEGIGRHGKSGGRCHSRAARPVSRFPGIPQARSAL